MTGPIVLGTTIYLVGKVPSSKPSLKLGLLLAIGTQSSYSIPSLTHHLHLLSPRYSVKELSSANERVNLTCSTIFFGSSVEAFVLW